MKWRKEAKQQAWIGRGAHSLAMVWLADGGYYVASTAQGLSYSTGPFSCAGKAKAFAMDLEDKAEAAEQ
jgi:hypothetical protein